jgi:hypothetical protein
MKFMQTQNCMVPPALVAAGTCAFNIASNWWFVRLYGFIVSAAHTHTHTHIHTHIHSYTCTYTHAHGRAAGRVGATRPGPSTPSPSPRPSPGRTAGHLGVAIRAVLRVPGGECV